jgi:4-methyl-5(b-hydroxyethyl)-thiazole monophosphate biosynthesis
MSKAVIFLGTGFEEIEAISVIDILRRAEIGIESVSISKELEVSGAHNVKFIADKLFDEVNYSDVDMLILPGGMPGTINLLEHEGLKKLLLKFNSENKHISAICAAPMILGKLNILNGKRATCYPGFEEDLIGAQLGADKVIEAGNIITSKGPGTAFDFAFRIVETLLNKRDADDIKKSMITR